jgi:hypothetical protein
LENVIGTIKRKRAKMEPHAWWTRETHTKYQSTNMKGRSAWETCMDGRIIFRSSLKELIVGLYIERN